MTEKDLDSMVHVQIKQEYAASDVFSTSSEAPPVYKHSSNSVTITKICAFTVIVGSFILGSFMLASAFVQARVSCNEMQALDSLLEKELTLETIQQELPHTEALLDKKTEYLNHENVDLQNSDKNEEKLDAHVQNNKPTSLTGDEVDNIQKNDYNLPLELDLSEFAAALLENNGKSYVNCVIERKHSIEVMNSPAQSMHFLFGYYTATDPKQRVTGEKISISCDSGPTNGKRDVFENAENIRPILVPISFESQLQQAPMTHSPQRTNTMGFMHPRLTSFNRIQKRPQYMQVPRTQSHTSNHVQSHSMRNVPIAKTIADDLDGIKLFSQQPEQMPQIQIERVPLNFALQHAGITTDDLRNIQLMAEDRLTEGLRQMVREDSASNLYDSEISEADYSQSSDQPKLTKKLSEPELELHSPMQGQLFLKPGRDLYERSHPNPVTISAAMEQLENIIQSSLDRENSESLRPHYVQPRSVSSIQDASPYRGKRVKRCICDCGC